VWFQDKDQMVVTIGNIEISTAFVTKKWIEVDTSPQIKKFDIEKLKSKNTLPSIDFFGEIKLFEKYGGLIVLKNFFPDEYEFLRKNFNRKRKNSLLKLLNGNSNLIKIILDRQVSIEDVKKSAKKYGQPFKKFAGMVEVDPIDINSPTYIFAILNRYRKLLSDNLDGLLYKLENLKDKDIEKYKGILFSYGLMEGYSGLSFKFYFENKKIYNRLRFEDREDFRTLEIVYRKVFKDCIPRKVPKKERLKFIEDNLQNYTIDEFSKRFNISSKQTLRDDIKTAILKSHTDFFDRVALFKRFNIRMNRNFFNEQLEEIIKRTNLSIKELADRLKMGEKSLKLRIRDIVDGMEYSFSYKARLLKKFDIRVSKRLRVSELKKLLKGSKLTTKELSKKLGITVGTVRNYLKEIGASKIRVRKQINERKI